MISSPNKKEVPYEKKADICDLALATLVSLIAGVSVTAQAATEYSSGTPVLKYGNAMYFIQEGRVNFNFSGTVTTAAGDFTVKNGVVV